MIAVFCLNPTAIYIRFQKEICSTFFWT